MGTLSKVVRRGAEAKRSLVAPLRAKAPTTIDLLSAMKVEEKRHKLALL